MQEAQIGKLSRYRWLIFWIMALSYVFVYFHRLCPTVVAVDLQKAFQASAGSMGLLASAYFYPYAIMQLPAGLLSDSLGPRKTVTCFLVIAGAGSLAFGLSPNLGDALVARVLVGLGVSMVFISAMKILSQWFRVREFAFMTAILAAMGGVGAVTAAAPLALMTGWVGWRASFEVIGMATLVMALLVWAFVRNRPEEMGWPSLAEIDHIGPGTSMSPLIIPVWEGALRVVTDRHFWPVAMWFFFIAGVFFGFGGLWAGPYFMHVYRHEPRGSRQCSHHDGRRLDRWKPSGKHPFGKSVSQPQKAIDACLGLTRGYVALAQRFPCGVFTSHALRLHVPLRHLRRGKCSHRTYHCQGTLSCRDSGHVHGRGKSIPISRGRHFPTDARLDFGRIWKKFRRSIPCGSVQGRPDRLTGGFCYILGLSLPDKRDVPRLGWQQELN